MPEENDQQIKAPEQFIADAGELGGQAVSDFFAANNPLSLGEEGGALGQFAQNIFDGPLPDLAGAAIDPLGAIADGAEAVGNFLPDLFGGEQSEEGDLTGTGAGIGDVFGGIGEEAAQFIGGADEDQGDGDGSAFGSLGDLVGQAAGFAGDLADGIAGLGEDGGASLADLAGEGAGGVLDALGGEKDSEPENYTEMRASGEMSDKEWADAMLNDARADMGMDPIPGSADDEKSDSDGLNGLLGGAEGALDGFQEGGVEGGLDGFGEGEGILGGGLEGALDGFGEDGLEGALDGFQEGGFAGILGGSEEGDPDGDDQSFGLGEGVLGGEDGGYLDPGFLADGEEGGFDGNSEGDSDAGGGYLDSGFLADGGEGGFDGDDPGDGGWQNFLGGDEEATDDGGVWSEEGADSNYEVAEEPDYSGDIDAGGDYPVE